MTTLNNNALATRLEVKNFLRMTGSDNVTDNLIHDLINRVSSIFEEYCGRTFLQADYTEYYDGEGSAMLFLDKYPVQSVDSIYDDVSWQWGSDTKLDSAYYRIADERIIVYNYGTFSKGTQNIKITYNAGFTSVPYDLKQACVEETSRLFDSSKNSNRDIISNTNQRGTVQYIIDKFLPLTQSILNRYKTIGVM
jgi:uncharacterized phiE125 gp8 family phage protein